MFTAFINYFKFLCCLGYKIIKVHEVYHFHESTQYDKVDGSGGLFTEYVNTFLQIKQQASGWPREGMTAAEKHTYVVDYRKNEGVQLDPLKIEKNPGLRSLAKLCLNS